ncbi:MAG: lipid A biosynthesis acyltransferase [Sphingobacteriales bacterium]|nr:MAG: lipid A biosynthesis acyltransferase [Sphingobacteriales bacterium]
MQTVLCRFERSILFYPMYLLLRLLLYPLSWLPLGVLYVVSDGARALLFGVLKYRNAIVQANLTQAFPEKSLPEIQQIHRAFEKAFCDQWIETIKLLSISQQKLHRRMPGNWELLQQLGEAGQDVYVLMGHQFNWEWTFVATQWAIPQRSVGFYLPVSNRAFDQLMQRIRSRGGGQLVSLKNLRAGLAAFKNQRFVAGLIADQNPSQPDTALWLPFMHREAPFFRGPEALARKGHAAVVFAEVIRHRRGQYEVRLTLQEADAAATPPEAITRRYVEHLEACLHRQPANYLWSHRRWKHQRKPGP